MREQVLTLQFPKVTLMYGQRCSFKQAASGGVTACTNVALDPWRGPLWQMEQEEFRLHNPTLHNVTTPTVFSHQRGCQASDPASALLALLLTCPVYGAGLKIKLRWNQKPLVLICSSSVPFEGHAGCSERDHPAAVSVIFSPLPDLLYHLIIILHTHRSELEPDRGQTANQPTYTQTHLLLH